MDNSSPETASGTQQSPNRFLVSLSLLASLIRWLAGLGKFTEEEQEDAGIYLDHPGGE